jgi:hypothetical protein
MRWYKKMFGRKRIKLIIEEGVKEWRKGLLHRAG